MQTFHAALPSESRLRVVFGDSALSFGFASRTTLADVAGWVEDVARIHHGAPLAIDITLAAKSRPLVAKGLSDGTR